MREPRAKALGFCSQSERALKGQNIRSAFDSLFREKGHDPMKLLYLDYNCFQRTFDDPEQLRIQLEAIACQELFLRALKGNVTLIWSFMHDDEDAKCPYPETKDEIAYLAALCEIRVRPTKEILALASTYESNAGLGANDAVHLACAVVAKAHVFLTCDDRLIRQARKIKLPLRVMNPVGFVTKEPNHEA